MADPAALVGVISDQRTEHGIPHSVSCRTLGVSEAWYYKWRRRPTAPTTREAGRTRLEERITHFFHRSGTEARLKIATWVADFYNTRRRHSAAGGLPPVEFERIISKARASYHQEDQAA